MFNLGFVEIFALAAIALLVIGPKQLPEVARLVGRTLNELKRATADLGSSIADVKSEAKNIFHETTQDISNQIGNPEGIIDEIKNDVENQFKTLPDRSQDDHLVHQETDKPRSGDSLPLKEEQQDSDEDDKSRG